MTTHTQATDGGRTETKRIDADLSLEDAIEGDRIEPKLIPWTQEISVGDGLSTCYRVDVDEGEDEPTFAVRLISGGEDRWSSVQTALIYDPEADRFARIAGDTKSGAMNQAERDWKIRDVGRDIEIVDQWDVSIPDLETSVEEETEFVEEWAEILFWNIRHGEQPGDEIQEFHGKKFTLRDYDNREARVEYELVDEDEQ